MRGPALIFGLVLALFVAYAQSSLTKRADNSFAGTNLYFLHALPKVEQETYVQTLAGWGVKLVRLWVTNVDTGCLKGSTIVDAVPPLEAIVGTYDTTVLNKLDDTLKLLHENGIKAIISPHNANSLTEAYLCDAYCNKYTDGTTFYSSTEAKADYDNRLEAILNYQSPNFNKPWKQLSEVIYSFNLQNEPLIGQIAKLQANDPDDWLCGRAGKIRELLGYSPIKVSTGGVGGSQYCCDHEFNLLEKALQCDALDIMSVHGYMSKASDWAYFITGDKSTLRDGNAAGKLVMVEEWGVSVDFEEDFDTQVQVFNDAGVPWLYWQVVPGLDGSQPGAPSSCGYDSFEIGVNSPKGDVASAVAAANAAIANQTWSGI
ncbi:glycoside hydrolase family 5 protein [Aaosphaeria arxii CBS 175.79]|uniref:mannan endo-1,4-beta-mannosidase n=1 Tax=Aaosphaeria arxii CBS 175.79 TaxID=1450172 RepID=A0A6A5XQY5_9PLEO|nr:glycoside hydrolase family 5 protein [Aaosphaeria arxii CBS 175.79]KAF2014714.1 glycoside hydrolase family 5 protein [Aaosphaeria arxii CBS 175.79]